MSKTLYFRDSHGERRIVCNVNNMNDAFEAINKFLENYPNFQHLYTRVWYKDGETWFDCSSHTEFFVVNGELKY